MKRLFTIACMTLCALGGIAQGLETFDYYRVEMKLPQEYLGIETKGEILFLKTMIIVKNSMAVDSRTFIINEVVSDDDERIVYLTSVLDHPDNIVVIEKKATSIVMVETTTGAAILFIHKDIEGKRTPLPEKDVWLVRVKDKEM